MFSQFFFLSYENQQQFYKGGSQYLKHFEILTQNSHSKGQTLLICAPHFTTILCSVIYMRCYIISLSCGPCVIAKVAYGPRKPGIGLNPTQKY